MQLKRLVLVALLTVGLGGAWSWSDDDAAPDPAAARHEIDALIKSFRQGKKRATPGLIQQAINLSIAFGAPTWNRGDHAACEQFYMKTAQSLIAAFPEKESVTSSARSALDDLQFAIDRAQSYNDVDRGAWSLRFAFDKNQLTCELGAQRAQSLIVLGEQYLKRSQFQESEDALQSAVAALADLDGEALEAIPPASRYAHFALANALFAQHRFEEASAAVVKGLTYLPQWPAVPIDLRAAHASAEQYNADLAALESKAQADPNSAAIQFLLGYEYWFTGRRPDAKDQFRQVLKIDPKHPGALLFLDPDAGKVGAPKPRA